jgi:hypothetical protein
MIRSAFVALLLIAPVAEARTPRVYDYERAFANSLIEGDGPSAFVFVDGPLATDRRAAFAEVMTDRRYRRATVVVVDVTRHKEFAASWGVAAPSLMIHYADDYVGRTAGPIDAATLKRELDRALATPVSRANRRGGAC